MYHSYILYTIQNVLSIHYVYYTICIKYTNCILCTAEVYNMYSKYIMYTIHNVLNIHTVYCEPLKYT